MSRPFKGGGAFAVIAIAAAAFAQAAAGIGTVRADYQFHNNHNSSVPGAPPIADLGSGNTFATETVAGCQTRVLAFPQHNGLLADTSSVIPSGSQAVIMDFRLSDVPQSGDTYERLIGVNDVNSDHGLYVHDGKLDWFSGGGTDNEGGTATILPNQFVEVALIQDQITTQFTKIGFVNGVQQFSFTDPDQIGSAPRLFKDNDGIDSGEDSAGAVFRVRFYDALNTPDVAPIYSAGLLGNPSQCPGASASRSGKLNVTKGGNLIDTGIRATCPDWGTTCNGTASLTVPGAKKSKAPVLNSVPFSIPSNLNQEVVFGLKSRGRKLLRKLFKEKGRLKATATVTITGPNGKPVTLQSKGKIKSPK
jgi:hypothetical protein